MDAAESKHVVLGLIILKYISDTFEQHRAKLLAGQGDYAGANAEEQDEYKGRICDPCCGSRGMFVQSEKFVEAYSGRLGDISIMARKATQPPGAWPLRRRRSGRR